MTPEDIALRLGAIGARLDGHDRSLTELKEGQEAGFISMGEKLDHLRSAEDRRRGAAWVLSLFAGSGLLVSVFDLFKGRHNG